MPASIEDTIELKVEERGINIPWWWRCNSFLYRNIWIELLCKFLRYNHVWTAKRTTNEFWWMFVWKIKVLRLSLLEVWDIERCYLHVHRHLHTNSCWSCLSMNSAVWFQILVIQFLTFLLHCIYLREEKLLCTSQF